VHDLQRTPWWRRCVRSDVLTLRLSEATLSTQRSPHESADRYDVVCRQVSALFRQDQGHDDVTFLHASGQVRMDVPLQKK